MISKVQIENKPVKHIINEVELILSQKRTALSVLRTGITVMLFPLSALTVLLATSSHYDIRQAWAIAIPLGIICFGLFVLGVYLITKATFKIKRYDRAAEMLIKQSEYLRDLLEL